MTSPIQDNTKQYGDSRKLAARARLNSRYTIAETGWFPWVGQHLPWRAGARILDIGAGPGWFWAAIAGECPPDLHLTLSDLSPGMVEEAVQRCTPLGFASVQGRQADASALPFDDGCFDGVLAMHMLYHLPAPDQAIAEMFRVLKPGGFLAVTTNGEGNMRRMHELAAVFGGTPYDPAAAIFGYDAAERLLRQRFGNVRFQAYPARMRITEPQDVFDALTSYPPGDSADEAQLAALHDAIAAAFQTGGGVLEVARETGLFLCIKA